MLCPRPSAPKKPPQLPPPIFRPEIRQSLGISPYFLVLEHLFPCPPFQETKLRTGKSRGVTS
ncbi:hypothetical protein SLEP1_g3681 [Rubroshorea leprosula]|uniref:Uncharacterized protein n=1 Tax=Rubroshorea leprosula TaxID=152421 RepID=A0AAV5HSA1_9ROSI|nr:hypothetical protein SLEP1_g3681 [Rubroshorea leprosula]